MPGKTRTTFKPGEGRPKGSQNKLTKTVKETVLSVFNELQGDAKHNLKAFAEKYPRDFYQIAAKLIPTEIKGDVRLTKVNLQVVRRNNTTEPGRIASPSAESNGRGQEV